MDTLENVMDTIAAMRTIPAADEPRHLTRRLPADAYVAVLESLQDPQLDPRTDVCFICINNRVLELWKE